jgi:hypothetical protein
VGVDGGKVAYTARTSWTNGSSTTFAACERPHLVMDRSGRTPIALTNGVQLAGGGAASAASFLAAVLTEIYPCNVFSCQEILRRNGRG